MATRRVSELDMSSRVYSAEGLRKLYRAELNTSSWVGSAEELKKLYADRADAARRGPGDPDQKQNGVQRTVASV